MKATIVFIGNLLIFLFTLGVSIVMAFYSYFEGFPYANELWQSYKLTSQRRSHRHTDRILHRTTVSNIRSMLTRRNILKRLVDIMEELILLILIALGVM